jgi:hypothetical protein
MMFLVAPIHPAVAADLQSIDMELGRKPFDAPALPLADSDSNVAIGRDALDSRSTQVDPKLLVAMITWLSRNFELPYTTELPKFALVPQEVMRSLGARYGSGAQLDAEAAYVNSEQVIYLPMGWTGSTPRESSLLIHKLVHHLQHLSAMKFACVEERERLAYQAQQTWLALFRRDLVTEFRIDPFTVLVRTTCPM